MTTTIANKWQILNCSNEEYLHIQHVDHPGYIIIKALDECFALDIWTDAGIRGESRAFAWYDDLRADGPKI